MQGWSGRGMSRGSGSMAGERRLLCAALCSLSKSPAGPVSQSIHQQHLACMSSSRFSTRPRKSTAGCPWSSNRHVVCGSVCSSSHPNRRLQQLRLRRVGKAGGGQCKESSTRGIAVLPPALANCRQCILRDNTCSTASPHAQAALTCPGTLRRSGSAAPPTAQTAPAGHPQGCKLFNWPTLGGSKCSECSSRSLMAPSQAMHQARCCPRGVQRISKRSTPGRAHGCQTCSRGASCSARVPRGCAQTRRLRGGG